MLRQPWKPLAFSRCRSAPSCLGLTGSTPYCTASPNSSKQACRPFHRYGTRKSLCLNHKLRSGNCVFPDAQSEVWHLRVLSSGGEHVALARRTVSSTTPKLTCLAPPSCIASTLPHAWTSNPGSAWCGEPPFGCVSLAFALWRSDLWAACGRRPSTRQGRLQCSGYGWRRLSHRSNEDLVPRLRRARSARRSIRRLGQPPRSPGSTSDKCP